jgi:hypothetical protein
VSYSALAGIGVLFLYGIVLCLEVVLLFPLYFAAILLTSHKPVRYLVPAALQWVWGCASSQYTWCFPIAF